MKRVPSFTPALKPKVGKPDPAIDLTGRNFFKEIEPFANAEEMRAKIATFTRGTIMADSFRSTFN
jgi:hypothetical protein